MAGVELLLGRVRGVIDQFVPAVIAWSHTPTGKLDKETLDGFAAALEEVTSASAITLRQWRGRLFGLRQLLFECGQLPKPPKRGPDGASTDKRLAIVPTAQIHQAMARYVQAGRSAVAVFDRRAHQRPHPVRDVPR